MFIPANNIKIGDWVITKKSHSSLSGRFTIGTRVKVIGIGDRGYDIQDEQGHRMVEIGWKI